MYFYFSDVQVRKWEVEFLKAHLTFSQAVKGKWTLLLESIAGSLLRRMESLEISELIGVVELKSIGYSVPKTVCKHREGLTYEQVYFKR